MPSLEQLTLQFPYESGRYGLLLHGIEWPAGLTQLIVGTGAHLDGVSIPPRVSVVYKSRLELGRKQLCI